MSESDSFENYVVELKGDDQASSFLSSSFTSPHSQPLQPSYPYRTENQSIKRPVEFNLSDETVHHRLGTRHEDEEDIIRGEKRPGTVDSGNLVREGSRLDKTHISGSAGNSGAHGDDREGSQVEPGRVKMKDDGDVSEREPAVRGTARVRARLAAAAAATKRSFREDDGFEYGVARKKKRLSSAAAAKEGKGELASGDGVSVGSLVWAKLGRFPWWPAQVIDKSYADDALLKERMGASDVLVRFFGTYDYAWVEPLHNLSKYATRFVERSSKQRKKSFLFALDEAEQYRSKGILPPMWDTSDIDDKAPSKVGKVDGFQHAAGKDAGIIVGKRGDTKGDGATRGTKRQRKRNAKEIFNKEEVAIVRVEAARERRVRVMRLLGLAPPMDSPFKVLVT